MHWDHEWSAVLLASGFTAAMLFGLRARRRLRSEERTRHLRFAADLLRRHAQALGGFLDDPAAPLELKRVLIGYSDAMTDREVVKHFARWLPSEGATQRVETEEVRQLAESVTRLRASHPALAENFEIAVRTIAVGAALRWPDIAATAFDYVAPVLVASSRDELAAAVTASRLRSGAPFSLRESDLAVA